MTKRIQNKSSAIDPAALVAVEVVVYSHPGIDKHGWSVRARAEINGIYACYADLQSFEDWAEPYGVGPRAHYLIPFGELLAYIRGDSRAARWAINSAVCCDSTDTTVAYLARPYLRGVK